MTLTQARRRPLEIALRLAVGAIALALLLYSALRILTDLPGR